MDINKICLNIRILILLYIYICYELQIQIPAFLLAVKTKITPKISVRITATGVTFTY
jgi:hypothetical protein